jgi:hypothetical protein
MLGSMAVCMSSLLLVLLMPLSGCAILCFSTNSNVVAAAVRDAVVDAVDELYLANCDAEEAAHNLVGLAQGSSLGALENPQTAAGRKDSITSGSAKAPRRRHPLWPPLVSRVHSLQDIVLSCRAAGVARGHREDHAAQGPAHRPHPEGARFPGGSLLQAASGLVTVIFAHNGQLCGQVEPSSDDP